MTDLPELRYARASNLADHSNNGFSVYLSEDMVVPREGDVVLLDGRAVRVERTYPDPENVGTTVVEVLPLP
ncbi:hypothetical protein [Deinococcus pimensis]|uniref:hypothetical protein n=1 Tax=Deinococcus pimensis TaxID=309888 RepID=UPI0004831808|nr:hypothetical protein [Deinococcus pimensis]